MASSITVIEGDTFNADVAEWVYKKNGSAFDITGASAKLLVEDQGGTAVLSVSTGDSSGNKVLISTGTDGKVTPDISATNMALLSVGSYYHDVEVTLSGVVTTIARRVAFEILESNS